MEHALAVSGSGEDMNYRMSLEYLGQEGVVQGSTTERMSAAINYNHRLFEDRLRLRATLRGARTDDEFTPGGVLGSATALDPTQPIRTDAGFFEWTSNTLAPNNPVAELALAVEEGTTYRSIGNIEAQYQMPFLAELSGTVRLGYDVAKSERRGFWPSALRSQIESPTTCSSPPCPTGTVNRSNPTETSGVLDAFLTYTGGLGAESQIDATAGYSYERTDGEYPFFQARGLSSDLLGPDGVPTAVEQITRIFVRDTRLASFFGRVNYTFRDRYLLTLSVRRDGSSRFGPDNQWGTFPSAAVAWRIGDEGFMDRFEWLSDLKLRASWGVNGNQSFTDYLWVSSYLYGDEFARVQFGNDFITTIRPSAVDPNIKWEETTSYNLGFDYGLFDDRLTGAVEYYVKDTDDLIFRIPVAAGTNLSNFVTTNVGSMRNEGFEVSLNARILDGTGGGRLGGLRWNASFNASTNSNELLSVNAVGTGSEQILVGGIAGGVGNTIQVLQPGMPINSFFVYRHRLDGSGTPIYSDRDGNGTINETDLYEDLNGDGVVNVSDREPYESPAPNWLLAHSSQFGYGPVDLSFTLRASLGNYVYNNVASNYGNFSALRCSCGLLNLHESVLENQFVQPQYFSDVYVEDASFVRMDNLTLGYTVPSFRGVQQMRLFGTIQNVFTWTDYTGIDPEAGLNGIDNNIYPRSRTFTAGVSLGF